MKRKAVTLLEVLFAIGIVSVGILGVMATLIVAGHQASTGVALDMADRVGRSAVQEFSVRGFDRPLGPEGTWASLPAVPLGTPSHPWPNRSYCLDPQFVAEHGAVAPLNWFPAVNAADGGGRLHRVSVRPFPSDQVASPVAPIGSVMAESIFGGQDDLMFELDDDRSLPPKQIYDGGRRYEGRYSWFATLQHDGEYCVLYIVVCRARAVADLEAERLVAVESLEVGGVTIKPRTTAGGTVRQASDLECRDGQWLMLVGIDPKTNAVPHRWYRILAADATDTASSTRYLSVMGIDWSLSAANTRAVLLDSVVAVYEKTIRMK